MRHGVLCLVLGLVFCVIGGCAFPVPASGACDAEGACPAGQFCASDNRCLPEAATCVDAVTTGDEHTCVIREDHTAWCWGRNISGQLGDGTDDVRGAPVRVVGSTKFVAIAAGGSHTCAVAEGGGVWCWGSNDSRQLGGGGTTDAKEPQQVAGVTTATAIASGEAHSCALLADSTVACWGDIGRGEFPGPTKVSGVKELAAGGDTTCGVTGDGTVACWDDGNAELLELPDGIQVDHIALGAAFLCVLSTGGAVYCMGNNDDGQLGTPGPRSDTLLRVPLRVKATGIFAGAQFACATAEGGGDTDRNVWCWGEDGDRQLADGVDLDHPGQFLSAYAGVVAGDGGVYHMCALSAAGGVTCSGFNGRGQLGDGHPTMQGKPPPAIAGLGGVTSIASGRAHSCAVSGGTVWCWGTNNFGQLGDGTPFDHTTPVRVVGVEHAKAVVANHEHSCALLEDGTAMCWGSDRYGQLGNGERPSESHFLGSIAQPVLDRSRNVLSGITQLAAGAAHTCAIAGSAVLCWGANNVGQVGNEVTDGLNVEEPDAVHLPPGSTPLEIAGGDGHVCALLAGGTVMCWGYNANGQLGNDDRANRLNSHKPVAVKMLAGAEHIRSYRHHTCAIAGGQAICWGEGDHGEIGSNDSANHFFPDVAVKMVSAPTLIATGGEHTCAVAADGLSCWGTNSAGQLGDGSFDRHFVPVPVAMATGAKIVALSGGGEHTCAVLEGGTVTCWGLDENGQLGDGAFAKPGRVSPALPCP